MRNKYLLSLGSICVLFSTAVFAFSGSRSAEPNARIRYGVDSIGIHFNGKKLTPCKNDTDCSNGVCFEHGCHDYNYCLNTDDDGECTKWDYCPYESSGDKIVGIPNADGGCAPDLDHRVVCLDTDEEGNCNSWAEPCLRTDEYHEIIGTPNARSFCCDPGTSHCDRYNNAHKCIRWGCGYTCSADTNYQFCNQDECAELGSHFVWDNGCLPAFQ